MPRDDSLISLLPRERQWYYDASDTVLYSDDAVVEETDPYTYTKFKEKTVPMGILTSMFRVKYKVQRSNCQYAHARVYKNGEAWGTEHTISFTGDYVDFEDDLAFNPGDKIQVYADCEDVAGTQYVRVKDFEVCGSPKDIEGNDYDPKQPSWS